jgi:hypothetical protein
LHRASGQTFIEVRGRREYLEVDESVDSRQRYYTRLAELASANKLDADTRAADVATAADAMVASEGMIVDSLLWQFWQWAVERHRNADGPTGHLENRRQTIKRLPTAQRPA